MCGVDVEGEEIDAGLVVRFFSAFFGFEVEVDVSEDDDSSSFSFEPRFR